MWSKNKPQLGAKQNWGHSLSRGLVGHWLMNEGGGKKAIDIKGINNGILNASASYGVGNFGKGLILNGSGGGVDLGVASTLNVPAISISTWIKISAFPVSYSGIYTKISPGYADYTMFLLKANGQLAYYLSLTGGSAAIDGPTLNTLSLNTLYHLVMTYNSSDGLKTYVNTVSDGTVAASGTIKNTTNNVQIGDEIGTAGRVFNGSISTMRVYDRALSAKEVRQLYTNPFADVRPSRNSWSLNSISAGGSPFSARAPYMTGVLSIKG